MISSDKLDRDTLLFIVGALDYYFHLLKDLSEEDGIHPEDRIKFLERLEGMRQAINKVEEYL